MNQTALLSVLLLLVAVSTGSTPLAFAAEPNQAGLVIQFGNGQVETRCITLEEGDLTGADLLIGSGLDVLVDASRGMGITVCQIQGQGCAYPAEPCFCQCMGGGECLYWNYFYRDPGQPGWTFSAFGALMRKVQPGSVEAWVWGDGHAPPSDALTFEAVCPPASPTPTRTLELPLTHLPTATAVPTPTQSATTLARHIAPSATPGPPPGTATPAGLGDGGAEPGQGVGGWGRSSYWSFGLVMLALVAIGVFIRFRRA